MNRECGMWINIVSHKIKKRVNAAMQSLGLTTMQSHVMHYILEKSVARPIYQKDVESAFGLSRSTATGILQMMEKSGLIRRESVERDARLKRLVPTEKAACLDAKMKENFIQMERSLAQGIPDDRLDIVQETLKTMSENLDGQLQER